VDENALRIPILRVEPSDDVGTSRLSFCQAGEDLLVEKLHSSEIEPTLDLREKQAEELLEERLQKFFESLVVSHLQ
jgi:hypothetical protein